MENKEPLEFMEEPTKIQIAFFEEVFPWYKNRKELNSGKVHYIFDKDMPKEAREVLDKIIDEMPFLESYSFE